MYSRLSFSFNTWRRSWTERSRAASKDMMATEGDGLRHARGWDRGVSPLAGVHVHCMVTSERNLNSASQCINVNRWWSVPVNGLFTVTLGNCASITEYGLRYCCSYR